MNGKKKIVSLGEYKDKKSIKVQKKEVAEPMYCHRCDGSVFIEVVTGLHKIGQEMFGQRVFICLDCFKGGETIPQ